MHRDQAMGLAALEQSRRLLEGEIVCHRGRVFATAGDSVLAEFASAVGAVLCAVEAQRRLSASDTETPADTRLPFRIGINLGDMITTADGNLYGDRVNLAARLGNVAQPG